MIVSLFNKRGTKLELEPLAHLAEASSAHAQDQEFVYLASRAFLASCATEQLFIGMNVAPPPMLYPNINLLYRWWLQPWQRV